MGNLQSFGTGSRGPAQLAPRWDREGTGPRSVPSLFFKRCELDALGAHPSDQC